MDKRVETSQDLRAWLKQMNENGELLTIKGASREDEIGGIVDVAMRKMGRPAVLFEDIPGYQKGFRVVANLFTSVKRIALSLGMPPDTTEVDLVRFWRDYMKNAPTIPPQEVNHGALMENTFEGDDINLLSIPTPRWHEGDGGYYIGTGGIRRHARPGHGLGQLWLLPHPGARPQAGHDHDLQGQARRHHHEEVPRSG